MGARHQNSLKCNNYVTIYNGCQALKQGYDKGYTPSCHIPVCIDGVPGTHTFMLKKEK